MSNPKRVGKDLTNGPIFPLLLSFAIPLILTGLVQQLYSTVDLMIIGQYVGSVGTVGVATGGELIDLMTPFSMAIATGGQIYIAQVAGAKNEKKLKEAVGTLLTLMMLLAAATTLAALFFHQGILRIMNCPPGGLGPGPELHGHHRSGHSLRIRLQRHLRRAPGHGREQKAVAFCLHCCYN